MKTAVQQGILLVLFLALGALVLRSFTITPQVAVPATPVVTPRPVETPAPVFINEDEVWTAVQRWRTSQNLPIYKKNEIVCKYAQERADQMLYDYTHNKFKEMSIRLSNETGLMLVSENLANGYRYPSEYLQGWLDSPTHKAALERSYTDSCIKCKYATCVQLFASK